MSLWQNIYFKKPFNVPIILIDVFECGLQACLYKSRSKDYWLKGLSRVEGHTDCIRFRKNSIL